MSEIFRSYRFRIKSSQSFCERSRLEIRFVGDPHFAHPKRCHTLGDEVIEEAGLSSSAVSEKKSDANDEQKIVLNLCTDFILEIFCACARAEICFVGNQNVVSRQHRGRNSLCANVGSPKFSAATRCSASSPWLFLSLHHNWTTVGKRVLCHFGHN